MQTNNVTVTVTLTREQWKALLAAVPDSTMTYTNEGTTVYSAYAKIKHALSS
jgi:hypothetical protein